MSGVVVVVVGQASVLVQTLGKARYNTVRKGVVCMACHRRRTGGRLRRLGGGRVGGISSLYLQ